MRIFDSKTEIKYGKIEMLDDLEIGKIKSSIAEIAEINLAIWRIVRKYGFPV